MKLTDAEQFMLSDAAPPAVSMAMRIVTEIGRLMGAEELLPITHAHIDGCVYFSESGVHFAEKLRDLGGKVIVPTSLNVGALDLINPSIIRHSDHGRNMAGRMMKAYADMGCQPSWTCAPYQAGHRPGFGDQIAWAESNAIAFANSVLGARTNRYGDFFDICAALTGRAPKIGLHLSENRIARVLIDVADIPASLKEEETFYPVLGTYLGHVVDNDIAAIAGIPEDIPEDYLKAMAAASAAAGAVGLFHVIGVTPEAPTQEAAFDGKAPTKTFKPGLDDLCRIRNRLSTATGNTIDCVALGSPHFSIDECRKLATLCKGQKLIKPLYVCTRPDVYGALNKSGERQIIEEAGGTFVVGTCVVVTPILRQSSVTLMTNSGKFAHYSKSTVNHDVIFGSLKECVMSAATGSVERDQDLWH